MKREEDNIQRNLISHLEVRGVRGLMYWHTPLGGIRSKTEAAILKGLGTLSGLPDLFLLFRGKLFGLELKANRGRVSKTQTETLAQLEDAGCVTAVVHGIDAAIEQLERWGLLRGKVQ